MNIVLRSYFNGSAPRTTHLHGHEESLVDYDALQDSAVFQDPCPNRQQDCLTVDMSLVTPDDGLKQHALFSVIGDVYFLPQIGSEKVCDKIAKELASIHNEVK